jgi:PAS domain S-box-containing protein
MDSKIKFILIRKWPVLVIIISLLLFTSGAYLYFSNDVKTTRREAYNELNAIADLKISQIANWNAERLSDAKTFSQNQFFVTGLKNLCRNKSNASLKSEIINNLELENSKSEYSNIILAGMDGEIILSLYPKLQQIDSVTFSYIKKAVNERKIIATDLYRSFSNNKIYLDYIAPVIDKSNTVFAVLILRVNPENFLYPLIEEWPVASNTSETLIVRKEGVDALYLNELNQLSSTALKFRIPLTRKEVPAVHGVLGYVGIFEGLSYHGTNVLSYISPVMSTPWIMITQIDNSEIYAKLYFKEFVTISFTFLLMLFLSGGLIWIYHYRQRNIYKELFIKGKELEEYHKEFKTILYSIGDGVISVDTNGYIKLMNHSAELLTGWSEAEVEGMQVEQVFKILNEETRNIVDNPITIVLRKGTVEVLPDHTILISKTGKEIPIADSAAPIKNRNGEILGAVLIFRNQTDERLAQRIIAESRMRFLSLFTNMNEGVALHEIVNDDNGKPINYRIIDTNPKYEKILEINRNEIVGKLATEVYNTTEAPYLEIFSEVALSGNPYTFETYYESLNMYFLISAVPWLENGFATIFTNITSNKLAEAALKESEQRFKAVYHASPSAISISEIETGKLIEINEAYEKLFGYSKDEVIGKSSFELGIWINSEDRKPLIDNILNQGVFNNLEIKFKTKKNTIIDCLLSGRMILLNNKKIMITLVNDITELQNAAQAIKESEERFRKIFQDHSAAKLLIDFSTGNIVDANHAAEKYYGWTKEELLKMNIIEINTLSPEEVIAEMDKVRFQLKNHFEFRHRLKNGSVRDVEIFSSKVEIGKKEYLHSIIHDITDRKLAEEELAQSSQKLRELNAGKDKLFSIIAHDLRGPFNPLLGLSELIVNDIDSLTANEIKKINNDIYNSLKNEYTLLENLLNLSSMETGQMKFNPVAINLYDKTESVINLLSGNVKLKNINLYNGIHKDVSVNADPVMLQSVLQNLITNSIKFSYSGSLIKIHSKMADDNFIQIIVSDSGVGMTDEQTKNLFGLTAASTKGTNNEAGTGLGLMICKEMVERHGGKISVKSEVGKGTDIIFTLLIVN